MTAPRGRIIAIASGKGGVGKTWFAITLSQALARSGRRVLLADGDFSLANVDVQLGMRPERDMLSVLAGRVAFEDAVLRQEPGGFDVLPGRSGVGTVGTISHQALDRIRGLLRSAVKGWDVVVLDLGAGVDTANRQLAAMADLLMVVTTPEPTSLTDAYAVLKLHSRDKPGGDARIVVNQAKDENSGRRTAMTLQRACQTFLKREVPLAGVLRRDERVVEAIGRQMPLLSRHPASVAAKDVEALAKRLTASR